jgi:hypothetical protein
MVMRTVESRRTVELSKVKHLLTACKSSHLHRQDNTFHSRQASEPKDTVGIRMILSSEMHHRLFVRPVTTTCMVWVHVTKAVRGCRYATAVPAAKSRRTKRGWSCMPEKIEPLKNLF